VTPTHTAVLTAVSARRVLYIEDDATNIRLVERILELRPAVELHIARTAEEGVRTATELIPDLVLLDRRLPSGCGEDILAQLGAAAATATIPVLMLSGDAGANFMAAAMQLGAVGYLTKPIDVTELLSIVDKYCQSRELTTGVHDPVG
jgi:DNA-binding response OmpR family regulator